MFIKLILLFTLIPILELYVLIEAGTQIGVGATIGLIILTGIQLINRMQNDLNAGRVPTGEMLDGAMILAGGLLLLTPGFCTDLFGFTLLTPATRAIFKGWAKLWLERKIARGEIHFKRL